MTSTLPPLVQAVSGAVGSAAASTLTYPLDLVTTRLQLDSPMKAKRRGGVSGGLRLLLYIVYGNEKKGKPGLGWKALYDGLGSDLFATVLSNFFYFYFYSFLRSLATHGFDPNTITLPFLRRILARRQRSPSSPKALRKLSLFEDLALGFVAGVASRAVSTPLNIITLRMQAERADTEDEENTDSESGSEPEIKILEVGDEVTASRSSSRNSDLSVPRKEDMGIMDVAKLIYEEEGLKGFWKGFSTSALLSLNPSITLAFFQLFRKLVVYSRNRASPTKLGHASTNLTPGEAFFVGAIANSIASTILYPLILAKKRLQSGTGTAPTATLFDVLTDAYLGLFNPHRRFTESGTPLDNTSPLPTPAPLQSLSQPNSYLDAPRRPAPRRSRSSKCGSRHGNKLREGVEKMEGVEGLYQGLQMQILKGFFNQGVTFLVKGRIEQLVVAAYLRRRAMCATVA